MMRSLQYSCLCCDDDCGDCDDEFLKSGATVSVFICNVFMF